MIQQFSTVQPPLKLFANEHLSKNYITKSWKGLKWQKDLRISDMAWNFHGRSHKLGFMYSSKAQHWKCFPHLEPNQKQETPKKLWSFSAVSILQKGDSKFFLFREPHWAILGHFSEWSSPHFRWILQCPAWKNVLCFLGKLYKANPWLYPRKT